MLAKEESAFAVGVVVGALIGIVFGFVLHFLETSAWEEQAIKRGFAEYNQTTDEWQWKKADDGKAVER